MTKVNNEILLHFARQGLTINKGTAIDARLVLSASRARSNEGIKKVKEKRNTSILKNIWDAMCRQMAFNLLRGSKLIVST